MMRWICILGFILIWQHVRAQDSDGKAPLVNFNGYIKNLQTLTFDKGFRNAISGNQIHNRLNLKWQPSETFTGALELRNRLFWGEQLKLIPRFDSFLRNPNEAVDMSKTWISNRNIALHSNVERLWMEYRTDGWSMRAGRQRINWQTTTIWNPNDVFNTYSFLDFDYEERPGSDALKLHYNLSDNTNSEFAVAISADEKTIGALKVFTNQWTYDLQTIIGWYHSQFIAGTGWAGSIGDAGFKGELMYFAPSGDSTDGFSAALEWDYVFGNGWYVNASGLYCSGGLNRPFNNLSEFDFSLSPKLLFPVRWAGALVVSKEVNSLLSGNLSLIYSPKTNLLILFPGIKYNMATNLDVDLIWQSFYAEVQPEFQDVSHSGFLRLKWSF